MLKVCEIFWTMVEFAIVIKTTLGKRGTTWMNKQSYTINTNKQEAAKIYKRKEWHNKWNDVKYYHLFIKWRRCKHNLSNVS